MTKFKVDEIVVSKHVDNAFYKIKKHYDKKYDVTCLWWNNRYYSGASMKFTSIDEDIFTTPTLEQTLLLTKLGLLKEHCNVANT